ncbi:hypothetical protein BJ508DRAFT_324711 [Ascobolus immersus RN42]|uniref:Uncharacterized protein n=1 Tax=Ascobolus immersus RN42 TaxID=1160509 RepID=A0A3N4IG60_ASCIM|nr:hypothetical protein BJ508DRAFT_324711 [Ascobolus immersus RN42]
MFSILEKPHPYQNKLTHPTTYGDYFNKLIEWTDSFCRIDELQHFPAQWFLPRIMARAFRCRVDNLPMTSSRVMAPEARQDPYLFVTVYTITIFDFFIRTQSPNDPYWLNKFLHTFQICEDDPAATAQALLDFFAIEQLDQLLEILWHDDPNPGRDKIPWTDDDVDMQDQSITLAPLRPDSPAFSREDTPMFDRSMSSYVPVPLPNIPVVRLTGTTLDVQRNVAITLPNGLSIYTYDQPPVIQQNNKPSNEWDHQLQRLQQSLASVLARFDDRDTEMTDVHRHTPSLPSVGRAPMLGDPTPNFSPSLLHSPTLSLQAQLARLSIESPRTTTMTNPTTPTKPADVNAPAKATEPKKPASPKQRFGDTTPEKAASPKVAEAEPVSTEIPAGNNTSITVPNNPQATPNPYTAQSQIELSRSVEFQKATLDRLADENASLQQLVDFANAQAVERRQRLEIKAAQDRRTHLQKALAELEGSIETTDRDLNRQDMSLRQHYKPSSIPRKVLPGTFSPENQPAAPTGAGPSNLAPQGASIGAPQGGQNDPIINLPGDVQTMSVQELLEFLAVQAPDAMDILRSRFLPTDNKPIEPLYIDRSAERFEASTKRPKKDKSVKTNRPPPVQSYAAFDAAANIHPSRAQQINQPYTTASRPNNERPGRDPQRRTQEGAPPGDSDSSDDEDDRHRREPEWTDHRQPRRRRRNREERRRSRSVRIRDPEPHPIPPPVRRVQNNYLGRLPTASLDPDFVEYASICCAPPHFQPAFAYDSEAYHYGTKKFNDRYDSRRIPVFHESKMPIDSFLTKLHVEISLNGEEAICPMLGQKAFPDRTFLNRWYNNLDHQDIIHLTMGPNAWINWQYAIYCLRDQINPLIAHQAASRQKQPDESYHAYVTSKYTLLKAASPYLPERELIKQVKTGFTDREAFAIMRSTDDIRQLEREALEYEQMLTAMARHTGPTGLPPTSGKTHPKFSSLELP